MKTVNLAAVVAAIAYSAETEGSPFQNLAEVTKSDFTIMPVPVAPRDEHEALDQQFALLTTSTRAAPGWAHAVLDFLWDLFF